MWVYLFSILAACANAVSSVIQRKANKNLPATHNLSLRLIGDLLHEPLWFLGILSIIAGFVLQAAALRIGALAVVQPILSIELPLTLFLAGVVFGRRMGARDWTATVAMTSGLAGLLYFLAPSGGTSRGVPAPVWALGIGVNVAVIALLVGAARHRRTMPLAAAALLGVATGAGFGLAAALMKAMTGVLDDRGLAAVFGAWPTYAMVVAGCLAFFLLQSALNKGPLLAAQPGFTIADPLVSILWGVLAFGENVNTGALDLLFAVLSALLLGWGVLHLSRSPLPGTQTSR